MELLFHDEPGDQRERNEKGYRERREDFIVGEVIS